MKRPSFLRALAVAACVLSAAPALAAPASPAAGMSEARAAIRDGRFDEALGILRPLAGTHGNARFLLGLAAVGAAETPDIDEDRRTALLDEAIAAFHTMLVSRPDLIRVRLELARAFFLKGEDGLAKQHFERVLAGKPPSGVVLNVNHFLAEIRARKRWTMFVGFALAPDTNIGGQSDERIIWIHGLGYRRDQKQLTSSGIGVSAWAGGEYQYPLADRWRLRAGGDVWRREYRKREFDRMNAGAHLGPRWLIGRAAEASLLATVRRSWSGPDPEYRDLGLRAEATGRLNRRTTGAVRASWAGRRYDESTHLDGPVTDVSLRAGHVLTPTLRADGEAGWSRSRPATRRWRSTGRWLRLGRDGGAALGLHGGRRGDAALDRLPGRLVPLHPVGRGEARPDPLAPARRPQPRLHGGRVQPRGSRWCRRNAPPTPSCTATNASSASSAS